MPDLIRHPTSARSSMRFQVFQRERYAQDRLGAGTDHVFAEEGGRTRIQWITDLLPGETAPVVGGLMEAGAAAMKHHLEGG